MAYVGIQVETELEPELEPYRRTSPRVTWRIGLACRLSAASC
jgi:hypothetical protein